MNFFIYVELTLQGLCIQLLNRLLQKKRRFEIWRHDIRRILYRIHKEW